MQNTELIKEIINCPSKRKRKANLEKLSKSRSIPNQDELISMFTLLAEHDQDSLNTSFSVEILQKCDPEIANSTLVSILKTKGSLNLLSSLKSPLKFSIDDALDIVKVAASSLTNHTASPFTHFIELILLQDDCWFILPNLIDILAVAQKSLNSAAFFSILELFSDFYEDPVFQQNIPKFSRILINLTLNGIDTSLFDVVDYDIDDNDYRLYINLLHRSMVYANTTVVNKLLNLIHDDKDQNGIVLSTLETLTKEQITPQIEKSIRHMSEDLKEYDPEYFKTLISLIDE